MSRNRMKNSQSLHWMGVIKLLLITSLVAGLGLCYVLCKNQNLHLAQETQRLQLKFDSITARNSNLKADLQRMKSITRLERALVQMHSTLVPLDDPRLSLVRLDEDTRARLVRDGTLVKSSINLNAAPVAALSPAAARN